MKKPLILFVVVFVLLAGLFISSGIDKVHLHEAIAKTPAYAEAVPEAIKERKSKRSTHYSVIYAYKVAGIPYSIESAEYSTQEAANAVALTPNMQVAYAQGKPEKAMLRSEFDNRDKSESVFGAILSGGGIALFVSLLVAAVLSWKFGWLRRTA